MTLLVSIHDVAPPNHEPVTRLWAMCRAVGVTPALLVVPDWHGEAPLERHPGFVAWVRSAASAGAEIVLHGERHDEVGRPRGAADAVRAAGRTDREGECLTLDPEALRQLVERGTARLRALGLEPCGFIPPAWLFRPGAEVAVGQAGLAFTEDDVAIHRFPGGRIASPVVRWSARTPLRAWGSVLVAAARWRWQRGAPVVRLALHPRDLSHPAVAASLERALRRWTGTRRPGRYADLAA
ncbi:MAG TPA: polysaccharide deacetylase family protein [Gemmatimonadales bacterium]|nr:polysaccharide deacetylase family protein [Gemmatimonadales bacterium]